MAQILNVLQKQIANKYVQFSPWDPDHLEAYYMLKYQGKQHPGFRFFLEDPYLDVVTMMQSKIAESFIKDRFKEVFGAKDSEYHSYKMRT